MISFRFTPGLKNPKIKVGLSAKQALKLIQNEYLWQTSTSHDSAMIDLSSQSITGEHLICGFSENIEIFSIGIKQFVLK